MVLGPRWVPAHVEGCWSSSARVELWEVRTLPGSSGRQQALKRPCVHSIKSLRCLVQGTRAPCAHGRLGWYSQWVHSARPSHPLQRGNMLCREGPRNEHSAGCEVVAFTCSHFHKLLHPPTHVRFMHTFEALINDEHCAERKKNPKTTPQGLCQAANTHGHQTVTKSNIFYSVSSIS